VKKEVSKSTFQTLVRKRGMFTPKLTYVVQLQSCG